MVEVTKDMMIGEVVAKHPESVQIMMKHGLHCVGCSVAGNETLEQGIMAHGGTEDDIKNLIKEINEASK